uniref:Uncharacterized protein n=1 Tax=Noctiluca scintillans TaxID=2966 RepID=A0A7S1F7J6_NOCSC|mmetsp:Transcript_38110/g.101548  ORF Transcript_38110/g.101548 Transcript_38110/m.101548 type:complete len:352 (+) Transcript_38110:92-1147(+)
MVAIPMHHMEMSADESCDVKANKIKKKNKRHVKTPPPKEDPMWSADWTSVEPAAPPLEVFDMGDCATWIMQLVQRKARAQRQGKHKMVQKLEKEIATAMASQRKKESEVLREELEETVQLDDSADSQSLGTPEPPTDDEWDTFGFAEAPYRLVRSEAYSGFLEASARQGVVPHVKETKIVKRLPIRIIGELGTPAYGLVEGACLWRKKTILSIGVEGWEMLVRDPKITASTFVLLGGLFKDITHKGPVSLFASLTEDLSALVPDPRATVLGKEIMECGRALPSTLALVCEQRDVRIGTDRYNDLKDMPLRKGADNGVVIFNIGDSDDSMLEIGTTSDNELALRKGLRRTRC